MVRTKKANKNNKFALGLIVLIILASTVGYFFNHSQGSPKQTALQAELEKKEAINLDPPTKEDTKRVADNKQAILEREAQIQENNTLTNGKKSVKPIVTYAGQYGRSVEVGGYVPGIFENGGTCFATFTQGSLTFRKSSQAVAGANSVDCPVIKAALSEFARKGTWNVILSYTSSTAEGQSDIRQFEVE